MDHLQNSKCEEFLNSIPQHQLLPLAESVTKLKLPPAEADPVTYILMYTKTPKELLGRHLIIKKYLQDYLWKNEKAFPKGAKKEELIENILDMWKPSVSSYRKDVRLFKSFDYSASADTISETLVLKRKDVSPQKSVKKLKLKVSIEETTSRQTQGMDQKEKINCEELLKLMPQADLLPLANTISKTECKNESEAIPAILMFTKSQKEILEKRKMKRETLELYLIRKGTRPPASARKHDLVEGILKLWNSIQ